MITEIMSLNMEIFLVSLSRCINSPMRFLGGKIKQYGIYTDNDFTILRRFQDELQYSSVAEIGCGLGFFGKIACRVASSAKRVGC